MQPTTTMPSHVPPATAPTTDRGCTEEERAYYATSRRVYGSWFASAYELITAPFAYVRELAARDAGVAPGTRALDVATGTGAQARAFADAGARVIGLDLSERMIGVARRRNGDRDVGFLVGDATALPFDDAGFDVACVSFALHEMPATVRGGVLRELARVVRPGAPSSWSTTRCPATPHGDASWSAPCVSSSTSPTRLSFAPTSAWSCARWASR